MRDGRIVKKKERMRKEGEGEVQIIEREKVKEEKARR